MPRRYHDLSSEHEPPRKKSSSVVTNTIDLKQGEIVTDISGKKWKFGKPIGIGGFGEIYQASDILSKDINTDTCYVSKVEKHSNGPLFVEINCYLRIAKPQMIEEWKDQKGLTFIGMPHYIASGSHFYRGERYRFLILPRYERDLEQVFQQKKIFNLKTVLTISIQILDVLEYIHSKGYVHSDIKASNIMLGKQIKTKPLVPRRTSRVITTRNIHKRPKKTCTRNLRPVGPIIYVDDIPYLDEYLDEQPKYLQKKNEKPLDQVYLLDYGLASKYLSSNGEHRQFCPDQRRAHAGTVLFCSRDAHKGIPSRRSDLESLAYNMVYWLSGTLPWIDDIEQPGEVEKKKNRCFSNLKSFLDLCFNSDYPNTLMEFFNYLNRLQFEENPDYDYCRRLFRKAIKSYGYKDDSILDFDNLEGWGSKEKKVKRKAFGGENKVFQGDFLLTNPRMPLHSNIIYKRPKLRKKIKNKKVQDSMMNWSKILMDPETIIKQARERKTTDGSDPGASNILSLDLDSMNPTYAMIEVYNKCMERDNSPRYKGDSLIQNIYGYTPAMMNVYMKMKERQELELEATYNNNNKVNAKSRGALKKRSTKRNKRSESPPGPKISGIKSQTYLLQKKEPIQLKKAKSGLIQRTYSLRG